MIDLSLANRVGKIVRLEMVVSDTLKAEAHSVGDCFPSCVWVRLTASPTCLA